MIKIAIFVEGQTELIFVDRLVHELAAESGLAVEHVEASGGASRARRLKTFKRVKLHSEHRIYVLIVNCGGDSKVKSDILERYHGLSEAGYTVVFGLRDVYGQFDYDDVPHLRAALNGDLPQAGPAVRIFLAVMEIEAWFLAEYSHLQRIDPRLTPPFIQKVLRFNPATDDLQRRPHPALDLDAVYRQAGIRYSKQRNAIERTVQMLDLQRFVSETARRFPDASELITSLQKHLQ